jgi:hypothetical protein
MVKMTLALDLDLGCIIEDLSVHEDQRLFSLISMRECDEGIAQADTSVSKSVVLASFVLISIDLARSDKVLYGLSLNLTVSMLGVTDSLLDLAEVALIHSGF